MPEAGVPPEDPIFVLTSSQLQEIISRAVQPLQDRISELEDMNILRAREIAQDRQRIAKLEKIEPQPLQKDRGEILRALIAANSGKMLAKDARQKMHVSSSRFSELLVTLKDEIDVKPYRLNKRQNILVLK